MEEIPFSLGFTAFQFLMVRLKVAQAYLFCCNLMVSIPYGTIKSRMAGGGSRYKVLFQFLMVRLKDG